MNVCILVSTDDALAGTRDDASAFDVHAGLSPGSYHG